MIALREQDSLAHWFSKCGQRANGGPLKHSWRPAMTNRLKKKKEKSRLSSFQLNPFAFVSFNQTVHYFERMNLSFVIQTSLDLPPRGPRCNVFFPHWDADGVSRLIFFRRPSVQFWVPKLALSCQNFENPCSSGYGNPQQKGTGFDPQCLQQP